MMKKKLVIVCTIFALIASFCFSQTKIPEDADFWSDYPAEELADFLVGKMSNDELLSQILMFGWAGAEPSELLIKWVYGLE